MGERSALASTGNRPKGRIPGHSHRSLSLSLDTYVDNRYIATCFVLSLALLILLA